MILVQTPLELKKAHRQLEGLLYSQAWLASGANQGSFSLTALSVVSLIDAPTYKGRSIGQVSIAYPETY